MKPPIADPAGQVASSASIPLHVAQPMRWDAAKQCFFVTYKSPMAARLRCMPKELVLSPVQIPFFLIFSPLAYMLLSPLKLSQPLHLVLAAVGSIVFFCFTMLLQMASLNNNPHPAVAMLSREGLTDQMPHKTGFYRWNELKRMKNWDGDLFFMVGPLKGAFFPQEAFLNRAEADRFFGMAQRLWQSQGTEWEQIVREFAPH